MSDQPVIIAADVAAGHDGAAEVSVEIRHPNGATRALSLPYEAVSAALDAAGVTTLDDLIGRPWTALAHDGLRPTAPLRTIPRTIPRGAP